MESNSSRAAIHAVRFAFGDNFGELTRDRRYFLLGAAPFFDGRLAIALLKIGKNNLKNELLFAMVVELDHDIVLITGHNASEPELGVIDLGSLREGGFVGH
jgi:hypothetical protein